MKKVFNSRGFVMALVGSIIIFLEGKFLPIEVSNTAMMYTGILFGAKVAGSEIYKSIRMNKGVRYDQEHNCEVMVEGYKNDVK